MGTLSALVRLDKRYLSPVEDLDHSFSILPLVQMASVPGIGVLPSTLEAKDSAIYQGDTFNGNQQQGITGGRHNKNYLFNINAPGSKGFDLLYQNIAGTALHDSADVSDQPRCLEGTRKVVIDNFLSWASNRRDAHHFHWLHGPAGAGKSTILRTIAHLLFHHKIDKNCLLASFFFLRGSEPRRGSCKYVIPTIAYQVIARIPQTRKYVVHAVEKDPNVFSLSLSAQASALLTVPITSAYNDPTFDHHTCPRVMVIDGLDECQPQEKQIELLDVLHRVAHEVPIPLAIVVASRPEHHIWEVFHSEAFCHCSGHLMLDNSLNPDADIGIFLKTKLESIRQKRSEEFRHGVIWPTDEAIDILVRRASGQFIYASTVERFVRSPTHDPIERLNVILGEAKAGSQNPYDALDNLYSTIFKTVDEGVIKLALRVLGFILIRELEWPAKYGGNQGRSPLAIEDFLRLKHGDIRRALHNLESLLTLRHGSHQNVEIFHASLAEYLFQKGRSKNFWIDERLVYSDITESFVHRLMDSNVLRQYFILNHDIMLARAVPTETLCQVLATSDVNKLFALSSSRGQSVYSGINACPTLLQIANHVSTMSPHFPSILSEARLSKMVAEFNRFIAPKMKAYFRNERLLALLVTATLVWHNHIECKDWGGTFFTDSASLTPGDKNIDRTHGFWILREEELPRVVRYVKTLLDDPAGDYVMSRQQYTNITLHLLRSWRSQSDGYPDPTILDVIWQPLFSKSICRRDIFREAKTILQSRSWRERSGLQRAVREYVSRAEDQGITWVQQIFTKPLTRKFRNLKMNNSVSRAPSAKELHYRLPSWGY